MKRNRILASMGLAVMGMGLPTPVLAADWRVCVVGACLKAGGCGDREMNVPMPPRVLQRLQRDTTQGRANLLD